jgi:hypothetical protein
MVPRPVRDIMGQTRLPALRGTAGFGTVIALGKPGFKFQRQLRFELRHELQLRHDPQPSPGIELQFRIELGDDRSQPWPDRRPDARRLVEHRRPAAQHLAACVLCAGGMMCSSAAISQSGYRAGQQAGGAGPVHGREGRPIALSRQQSNLAKPVAAADHTKATVDLVSRGRSPWKSSSNSRTGARFAA